MQTARAASSSRSGVRNSVGFAWQPELEQALVHGQRPRRAGRQRAGLRAQPRSTRSATISASRTATPATSWIRSSASSAAVRRRVQPAQKLGPHVAPLAVRFYTGNQFPAAYQNQAFVAQHGSWNRSTAHRLPHHAREAQWRCVVTGYEPFLTGWLKPDGNVTGRPVDLQLLHGWLDAGVGRPGRRHLPHLVQK